MQTSTVLKLNNKLTITTTKRYSQSVKNTLIHDKNLKTDNQGIIDDLQRYQRPPYADSLPT